MALVIKQARHIEMRRSVDAVPASITLHRRGDYLRHRKKKTGIGRGNGELLLQQRSRTSMSTLGPLTGGKIKVWSNIEWLKYLQQTFRPYNLNVAINLTQCNKLVILCLIQALEMNLGQSEEPTGSAARSNFASSLATWQPLP